MTGTNPPPRAKRLVTQLGPAAGLALMPKCAVCAFAYAGVFGLGGAELCGATPPTWTAWLPLVAGILAAGVWLIVNRRARRVSVTS